MGRIFAVCAKCGKEADVSELYSVTINESGMVRHYMVCSICQSIMMNENYKTEKLLTEG